MTRTRTAQPLEGKVVLVTRAAGRDEELSSLLRARGAIPIDAPAIELEPVPEGGDLDDRIRDAAAGRYGWVVFTSGVGVEAWFERAEDLGVPPLGAQVAAVGSGTATALRLRGVEPDLVPETFTTEALAEAFPDGAGGVVLPRADIATEDLEDALRAKGWTATRTDAYRTRLAESIPEEARQALDDGRVDAVTFTSASTVKGFVQAAGVPKVPVVACIGPVTADAARDAGLPVHVVAEPHTIEGLVDVLARAFAEEPRPKTEEPRRKEEN